MGRRGARLRPGRTSDSHPLLRLVVADRGQRETAVLCRSAYRADQLAPRGGASDDRRGEQAKMNRLKKLWLTLRILLRASIQDFGFIAPTRNATPLLSAKPYARIEGIR